LASKNIAPPTLAIGAIVCGIAWWASPTSPTPQSTAWPHVFGDPGGTRYSPLTQITGENVSSLEVAWTYRTADADPAAFTTIECTPIVIGGVMFVTSARGKVMALDAATGQERWRYDPFARRREAEVVANGVNRGVAWWPGSNGAGPRIFHGTADGRLIALDAATGTPIDTFGRQGAVDLAASLEPAFRGREIGITSAPAVFEDLVIVGTSVGEGPEPAAAGDILAFDARTGRERWRFRTVPRPGEVGHETWDGDSWQGRGGANAWAGVTIDATRGLVFAGTGSPAFDFYGGDRAGNNLFANSTLALDARTGTRRWHYQIVRHDLWDYDLPTPPALVHVTHGGKPIEAVAQVTKNGFVYLFDRATGRPLFGSVERNAAASDVPGERAATTQPAPARPPAFVRQGLSIDEVDGTTPEAREDARRRFRAMRSGPLFTPPSLEGTLALPGTRGGATWSGASFDPDTSWLYVNANELASIIQLAHAPAGQPFKYRVAGYRQFVDMHGYPAIKPPWGTLSAIDLNQGRIVWQVPLGEFPELAARGVRNTGTENFGGTIVTAGGLVFIGGSKDEKFHAFDKRTGKLLWEYKLPAGGYATPATYAIGGRQFVVIAAGGGGKPRTKSGDTFVAFALPRKPAL
jgi:quinoprotein glucose dehydrogenase